jgi:hypothetical protein
MPGGGSNGGEGPVTFRPALLEDKAGIMQLHDRSPTAGARRDPKVWDWLFTRNTSSSQLYYYVAESNGAIVAQNATLPVRLSHAGRDLAGLLSLHSATDAAYGGRGLFTTLGVKLYTGVASERPVVFGFPNPASAPIFYRKLGWVELRPFPAFIRPLGNIRGPIAERRPRLLPLARLADALAPAGLIPARAVRRLAERTGARVVTLDGFGPWADELWEELRPSLGTCAVRDAAFLRWRFRQSPFRYRLYGLDRGSGPIGFAVLRARPGKFADLMELMVPPEDHSGAELLLAQAICDAWASGSVALRAIVSPRHPHRPGFLKVGFLRMPRRLKATYSFGVCVLDRSLVVPNALLHMDDWYISGADYDSI